MFRHPARIDFSKPQTPEVADAIAAQNDLRVRVRIADDFASPRFIAGIDAGYDMERALTRAVVVLMDYPALTLRETVIAHAPTDFPYISGLLAFREIPAIRRALACLSQKPDMLMVDGQGIAHPRRLGIAAHLGVLTDIPAIGVAKSRLWGKHDDLPAKAGCETPLWDKGEKIGTVFISKDKCKPLYISAGHRVSHETAMTIVKHSLRGYRLPEPTRVADQISKWKAQDTEKDLSPMTKDLFGV